MRGPKMRLAAILLRISSAKRHVPSGDAGCQENLYIYILIVVRFFGKDEFLLFKLR